MIMWDLFFGFLKVGCFSFGGAYAAIPLIRDVVLSYGWLSDEILTDMIAVSESTPGPIMVNLATYIGSSQAGLAGAALATFAVILPAFLIILLITLLLKNVLKSPYVQAVMRGLSACVIGVILATGCGMLYQNAVRPLMEEPAEFRPLLLGAALLLIRFAAGKALKKKVSPILQILIAAGLGVALFGV